MKILKVVLFQALSSPVLSAVAERYYKVTAEALRVCGELVRVVRPSFQVTGDWRLEFIVWLCKISIEQLLICFVL